MQLGHPQTADSKCIANKISTSDITLQYQVDQGLPPVKLDNYSAVNFYMELKKRDSTLTIFPLCITKNGDSMSEHLVSSSNNQDLVEITPSWERENLGLISDHGSNNFADKGVLLSYIEYVNKFADSILEDVHEETEKDEIVIKSTIIEKPDIKEIAKDQLYENREVLKTSFSLYAIRNNFQYRVNKSCMKELDLLCIDLNCKWSLRAS